MRVPINAAAPGPGEPRGNEKVHQDAGTTNILAPAAHNGAADTLLPLLPEFTPEAAANIVNGAFVVVVRTAGDRYRRRVLLSLSAAEANAQRARDRGQDAQVLLARLEPVGSVIV